MADLTAHTLFQAFADGRAPHAAARDHSPGRRVISIVDGASRSWSLSPVVALNLAADFNRLVTQAHVAETDPPFQFALRLSMHAATEFVAQAESGRKDDALEVVIGGEPH